MSDSVFWVVACFITWTMIAGLLVSATIILERLDDIRRLVERYIVSDVIQKDGEPIVFKPKD